MELTIALNRYDRHVPFFNGTVTPPDGITLRPFEIGESTPMRDGTDRHRRMLKDYEFDICELSLSSFIMSVARDPELPIVGVPAFPRRFFSVGQIYVNVDAGINEPGDLIGRNVGLHSFQTTLSVLAKGDLKLEYGVPWEQINWHCMRGEAVPVALGGDVSVQQIPDGADIGEMLIGGEIDALISPQPRKSMLARPDKVRRLFQDTRAEEQRYFTKYGYFPIMHIMTCRRALADSMPDLAHHIMALWEQAKGQAYGYYDDSNYSLMAWGRNAFEDQRTVLGADPWPSGLAANRANLEQFIGYCFDQRLIEAPIAVESLFHPSVRNG